MTKDCIILKVMHREELRCAIEKMFSEKIFFYLFAFLAFFAINFFD